MIDTLLQVELFNTMSSLKCKMLQRDKKTKTKTNSLIHQLVTNCSQSTPDAITYNNNRKVVLKLNKIQNTVFKIC